MGGRKGVFSTPAGEGGGGSKHQPACDSAESVDRSQPYG